MRVDEIYTELFGLYGGYMSVHSLATFLRVDDPQAKALLDGLRVLPIGKRKKYRTRDVARRLAYREES